MHLVRRWWTSLDRSPIPDADEIFVREVLLAGEHQLWTTMTLADRRHSIVVARRFMVLVPTADPSEVAAALLHDVGKSTSSLSTTDRIVATLIAPLGRPRRFDEYYRHEEIGLDLCRRIPSRERTLSLLAGVDDPMTEALRLADDV